MVPRQTVSPKRTANKTPDQLLRAAAALSAIIDPALATGEILEFLDLGAIFRDSITRPSYVASGDQPSSSEIFLAYLPDGEAFFKPVDGFDGDLAADFRVSAVEQAAHEVAAYAVAVQLGSPWTQLVAGSALRTIDGRPGTLSRRKDGEVRAVSLFESTDDAYAGALFDALIANQDRHRGNWRYDANADTLGLFDHGLAFAVPGGYSNASMLVEWREDNDDLALTDAEIAALTGADLSTVEDLLSAERHAALLARRARMLSGGVVTTEF